MPATTIIAWTFAALVGVFSLRGIYRALFADRSRGVPRCPKCWYNLTGAASLTCPECGRTARSTRALHRTRRRRGRALLYVILLLVAAATPLVERVRHWSLDDYPTVVLFAAAPVLAIDRDYISTIFMRENNGLSDREIRLADWSFAFAIRQNRNRSQMMLISQTLVAEGCALPRCVRAIAAEAADPNSTDHALGVALLRSAVPVDATYLPLWQKLARESDNPGIRRAAIYAIGEMGEKGLPALDLVIAALDDPSPEVVAQAASSLGALGHAPPHAVLKLAELLSVPSYVGMGSAIALGELGDHAVPAIPEMIRLIGDPACPIQELLVGSLGMIGPPAEDAVPMLLACAASDNCLARAESLVAVARIVQPLPDQSKREEPVRVMLECLDGNVDPSVRVAALQALFLIDWEPEERGPDIGDRSQRYMTPVGAIWGRLLEARSTGTLREAEAELLDLLAGGYDSAKWPEQEAAIEALSHLESEAALPVLERFVSDRSRWVTHMDRSEKQRYVRRHMQHIKDASTPTTPPR